MVNDSDLLRRIEMRFDFVKQKLDNVKISESGCWEYQGDKDSHGYGRFTIYARYLKERKRKFFAHRVAYAFFNGADPGEKLVCHKCDNPCCINPDHLFLGSHQDNMNDMRDKGRRAPQDGENNGHARLDEPSVREIIKKIQEGKTNIAIAKDHGVTHSQVSLIRRGKVWQKVANDMNYEPKPCFKRRAS